MAAFDPGLARNSSQIKTDPRAANHRKVSWYIREQHIFTALFRQAIAKRLSIKIGLLRRRSLSQTADPVKYQSIQNIDGRTDVQWTDLRM